MWLAGPRSSPRAGVLPTRARLQGIPDGLGGAIATLKEMRNFVRESLRDGNQQVREAALAIVSGSQGWVAEVRAVQQWVQDNIAYRRDPIDSSGGVELIQTPQKTLDYAAGDCDDQAILTSALLSALGHPTRFIALWFDDPNEGHVLTQTLIGQCWAGVETIQPRTLGWMPPGVRGHYILKV